jgi:hypothetical protein
VVLVAFFGGIFFMFSNFHFNFFFLSQWNIPLGPIAWGQGCKNMCTRVFFVASVCLMVSLVSSQNPYPVSAWPFTSNSCNFDDSGSLILTTSCSFTTDKIRLATPEVTFYKDLYLCPQTTYPIPVMQIMIFKVNSTGQDVESILFDGTTASDSSTFTNVDSIRVGL